MALVLPLLMSSSASPVERAMRRLVGLFFSPALVPLAIAANLSLLGSGGDDCLGYTAVATRKSASA
jgi:hypothetical protein